MSETVGALISIAYIALFILASLRYAALLLPRENTLVRGAFGVTLALFAQMWLPALLAFLMNFTYLAQLLALGIYLAPLFFLRKKRVPTVFADPLTIRLHWLCVIPAMLLCAYLLHTHILRPENGALHTGQSCYGDMAMHLSFISSIARTGAFPPEYSIQSGVDMGYPFLCDSVSSTYAVFGASPRFAYILPMLAALYAVFSWYFLLMDRFLRSPKRATLAYVLFFLGGGIALWYFLDGARLDPRMFTRIFTEFYETPTNNVNNNVLWVNPIADLLIPQRATLFGWAILLPCLYMLWRMVFENEWKYAPVIGVLAGGLPLLHTHSFLALAVISAGCVVVTLRKDRRNVRWLFLYAGITLVLSLPQLICFTFAHTAGGEGFLHLHFNWSNSEDPYLWFYIKNIGLVFLLLPFALLTEKRLRPFWLCALPLWIICEFIVFQPNNYDNNKLLFVVHMLSCGVVASFISTIYHKLQGVRGRALMGACVVFVGTISGTLTLAREAVSDYELFSAQHVKAAQFAADTLPDDAVLLTADHHNNAFASLGGLTIVQGSPSYLYFHGVYDEARAQDVLRMYTEPGALDALKDEYGITHVVLSHYEYAMGADAACFEHLNEIYREGDVTIYEVK